MNAIKRQKGPSLSPRKPGSGAAHSARARQNSQVLRSSSPARDPETEQVDRLIASIQAGKIRWAPEIEANFRNRELTLKDWPCKRYLLRAGERATEIVARGEKPKYRDSVVEESRLSLKESEQDLAERVDSIRSRANDLHAQRTEGLLVLLDGDNASGKDGLIKHVFALNPLTTSGVSSIKAPKGEELNHAPNWRVMRHLPGPGQIGIHNRSAYGDVVFGSQERAARASRVAQNIELEYGLTMGLPMTPEGRIALPNSQGQVDPSSIQRPPMRILKVMVNTSKAEQAARFAERLLNEDKLYKSSRSDLAGHARHDEIQDGYAQAMLAGSTDFAPAYLLPNDTKLTGWRKFAEITDKVLQAMDPQSPGYDGEIPAQERRRLAEQLLAEVEAAKA